MRITIITLLSALACLSPLIARADANTDMTMAGSHYVGKLMINELEAFHDAAGNGQRWDAEAWYGSAFNKLWFKSEGERNAGNMESASLEALFSHAVAPFWDVQIGARQDASGELLGNPAIGASRNWAAIGIQGLAPWWFELEATGYVGQDSRTAARFKASYEMRFTQQWILEPEMETWLYGKDDLERGVGKGLASMDTGLRLRYEIRRRFAPYVGVTRNWLFGHTADFARQDAQTTATTEWSVGLRFWY